jgi:hypothetical protein
MSEPTHNLFDCNHGCSRHGGRSNPAIWDEPRMDAEHEADLINGRACASCGGGITPEDRVPHGGFWICQPGCAG